MKAKQIQHQTGRRVTDIALRFANVKSLKNDSQRAQLITSMQQFIRMYNPHEARGDCAFSRIPENRVAERIRFSG